MPLHVASYFAGVGTVLATITLGFGAGVMMTDAFLGTSDDPPNLVERRSSPAPEPDAPLVAATPVPEPTSPQPPAMESSSAPSPAPQATTAAQQAVTVAPELQASHSDPAASLQAREDPSQDAQQRRNDEAKAKAREIQLKKAQNAERRKEQRRKLTERRKREQERMQELEAVAERVRAAEREPVGRPFFAESPAINLFEDE